MTKIGFLEFISLLVISITVSSIMFFILKIKISKVPVTIPVPIIGINIDIKGYIAEIIVGFVGARLGWIWGHWWFKFWDVYIIPSIIGSVALILIISTLFPQEIKEEFSSLREAIQSLAISVDKLSKVVEDLRQEYVAITAEVDKHGKWIQKIADKLAIELDYL